jgi:hypothetical protein
LSSSMPHKTFISPIQVLTRPIPLSFWYQRRLGTSRRHPFLNGTTFASPVTPKPIPSYHPHGHLLVEVAVIPYLDHDAFQRGHLLPLNSQLQTVQWLLITLTVLRLKVKSLLCTIAMNNTCCQSCLWASYTTFCHKTLEYTVYFTWSTHSILNILAHLTMCIYKNSIQASFSWIALQSNSPLPSLRSNHWFNICLCQSRNSMGTRVSSVLFSACPWGPGCCWQVVAGTQ